MLTLRAEESIPTLVADTLKRFLASAVLTSRQSNTVIAKFTVEAKLTATFTGSVAETCIILFV